MHRDCDLRAVATEILDEGYLDCGDFTTDQDSAAGTACAVDALVAADPFLLVVETTGTDSLGTRATVHRDGRLLYLYTDAWVVFDPGPVTAIECVDPFVQEGGLAISCGSLLPRSPGHDYYDVCTAASEGVIPLPEPWYTWAALASP